ncbi:Sodium/hydrogen exchanger [Hesseltinella vesiculosa]|uniref:Sodium/hydrogen exchanger n=1 Tax=Hesseltinella vesiculosa TaxID=101127 RepID=A0A1X2GC70_9FUNG|nr:Sodium/hydrogen exchanger [Hesseltinella vesiculosa]
MAIKERLYMSEAFVALAFGILFGPVCLNIINLNGWEYENDFTGQLTRIVIAIQVMAAGIILPKRYLFTQGKSLSLLLGPVMVYMWIASALCVEFIFPSLSYLEALMLAACFTPTDPVLANSIVQGHFAEKYVPPNIRHIISAESAANDGLGYPFLFLAIFLLHGSVAQAVATWTVKILLYNIGMSVVLGIVLGHGAKFLLQKAKQKKIIDHESFLVFAIAFTFFLMGLVDMLGCDDLLACFIAGNAITWDDWFNQETEDTHIMQVTEMLLNLNTFVYIGATIPWSSFVNAEIHMNWIKLVLLAILVLLFRRLPVIMAIYKYIPAIRNWREAVFVGWFGPIGVGAIFYYTLAIQAARQYNLAPSTIAMFEPITYFLVLASVVVHGCTIPIFRLGVYASRTLSKSSLDTPMSFQDEESPLGDHPPALYGSMTRCTAQSSQDSDVL